MRYRKLDIDGDIRRDFYVYIIFSDVGVPEYVGKGCGGRMYRHNRLAGGKRLRTLKVREELSEGEALELERSLIIAIGRSPSGILRNKNDGGTGSRAHSEETKAKIRASALARGCGKWNAGRKHSDEVVELIRDASVGRKYPDRKPRICGWKHTEEIKAHWSAVKKGIQKHTPEARAKISAVQIGRKLSPETRAKIAAAHLGKPKRRTHNAV